MHDEIWVLKEIEKHCLGDVENCIDNEEKEKHHAEEREVRLARRRKY